VTGHSEPVLDQFDQLIKLGRHEPFLEYAFE